MKYLTSYWISAIFLFAFLSIQCSKDSDSKFRMRLESNLEIPAGLNVLDGHHFLIKNIQTNYASLVNSANIPSHATVSLIPDHAFLRDIFGSEDLDFIEKVSLKIYTNNNPTDRPEAFYQESIPLDVNSELTLFPTTFEAAPFLNGAEVNVDIGFFFRRSPSSSINLNLQMEFKGNY